MTSQAPTTVPPVAVVGQTTGADARDGEVLNSAPVRQPGKTADACLWDDGQCLVCWPVETREKSRFPYRTLPIIGPRA